MNREGEKPAAKVERLITAPHLAEFLQGFDRWMSGNLRELEHAPLEKIPENFGEYLSRLEAYCAQCIMHLMDQKQVDPMLSQSLKDAINDIHTEMIAGVPKRFEEEFNAIRNRKLSEM